MPRPPSWQDEIRQSVRRDAWALTGPNSLVKVLAWVSPTPSAVGGYFTVGKYLVGKTPLDIEQLLGLPHDLLSSGAKIYRFQRRPMAHEYEYELTASQPGGLAFNPAHSSPDYPPGSHYVHQWRIKDEVRIPVDTRGALLLEPGHRFPYEWL